MIRLPDRFVQTLKNIHKDKAEEWLQNFGSLIHECERRWQLKIGPPFDLSYNFVAPALRNDGTEAVVKLAVPGEEFLAEALALRLFDGNGIVKVLDVDPAEGILLLERLSPGTTLATVDNEEDAVRIASQVMKKLWIPAPAGVKLPTSVQREQSLRTIYSRNPEGLGPITKELLQEALHIFHTLNSTPGEPFLLHGDLHHYNILAAEREPWLAIDPKGLIGDREYDVIQFLLNKLPDEHITDVTEKRIDLFARELNLDKARILAWGFSHAVLAACWTVEENGAYNEAFFKTVHVFKHLHRLYSGT